MIAFLAIGSKDIEEEISSMKEIEISDNESNLNDLLSLLEFVNTEYLILNRLLDDDNGEKIIKVAELCKQRKIKIILLFHKIDTTKEKLLITELATKGVNAFLNIKDIDEDRLIELLENYPEEFDFNIVNEVKEKNEKVKIIEKPIEIEVETVINKTRRPTDYKKIVAVTGVPNSGKSSVCFYCSAVISNTKKAAIIDLTENQDFKYYFAVNEEMKLNIENKNPIQVTKNIFIYPKEIIGKQNIMIFIDKVRQDYDVIIIDLGTKLDEVISRYVDNLFIIADNDISHTKEVNNYLREIKLQNIPYSKVKLIFNKIISTKYVDILSEIAMYDIENKEITCSETLDKHYIKFVTNKELYDKIIEFDIEALNADEEFFNQIKRISNDIYSITTEKNGLRDKLKKVFRRKER